MNDQTRIEARPEIANFVTQVRAHLHDLSEDERDELVGGLEADLTDQLLADDAPDGPAGPVDVGDPAGYAAELRAAAGFPERPRRLLPAIAVPPANAEAVLDGARARFENAVAAHPWTATGWELLAELRPVWWVARAWIALTALDVVTGSYEPVSVVPSFNIGGLGWGLLAGAIIVSVLVGSGRLWPGSGPDRAVAARLAVIALNVTAALLPFTWSIAAPGYLTGVPESFAAEVYRAPGLQLGGQQVTNVFAYDAQGRPLEHVQLFDQDGDPLALPPRTARTGYGPDRVVACPALNGVTPLFNVFPLDQLSLRRGSCDADAAGRVTPDHPLAQVPPVMGSQQNTLPAETEPAPQPGAQPEQNGQRDRQGGTGQGR